jgi:hypothetical protein
MRLPFVQSSRIYRWRAYPSRDAVPVAHGDRKSERRHSHPSHEPLPARSLLASDEEVVEGTASAEIRSCVVSS